MPTVMEGVAQTLPQYLSPKNQEEMLRELKSFPKSIAYYVAAPKEYVWQGDVYQRLLGIRIKNRSVSFERGTFLVASNTCDVTAENKRARQTSVVLAPIATLARFISLLERGEVPRGRIDGIVDSIRNQENTSIFFLPGGGGGLAEDSVVFLDAVQSIPLDMFQDDDEKVRSASLSNVGWYLLLVKLALHFCRAFEGEPRSPPAVS